MKLFWVVVGLWAISEVLAIVFYIWLIGAWYGSEDPKPRA